MAFGLINYSFLFTLFCASLCLVVLVRRYLQQRRGLTLFFVFFLAAYAIEALTYALRGFYEAGEPEELLLWVLSNYMYIVMVVPLALFLIHPLLQQTKGQKSFIGLLIVVVAIAVIAVFNAAVIAISEIQYTYTDNFGLAHYALLFEPIPYVYYITLLLDVMVSNVSLVLLGISYRRETDLYYKRKALFLVVGWTISTYGQLLLLGPSLAILNPFAIVIGAVLVTLGVAAPKSLSSIPEIQ